MARKKKSVEETTEKTILRNYDIFSLENRVHAMDKKIQRSYDIYSIEKRIHDLEMNGGGGGGSSQLVALLTSHDTSEEVTEGTPTAKDSYSEQRAPISACLKNNSWVGKSNDTWWAFTFNTACKPRIIAFTYLDLNRQSLPTSIEISTDGETFTEITPTYMYRGIIFLPEYSGTIKAVKINYVGTFTTSTYPIISSISMFGYEE